jgi:uncharacterized protein YecE (DUF72 family)
MADPALFPEPDPVPATPPTDRARIAERLPPRIRFGTSSWTFPGWTEVWGRPTSPEALARAGLAAYARHPLLRAVGVDRTFYAPVERATYAAWADQVPPDFRFVVKAPGILLRPRDDDGRPNPRFLDAAWAVDHLVAPAREGLRDRLGSIVLQLSPLGLQDASEGAAFARRLGAFLRALPPGRYAVEARDRALYTPAWAEALGGVAAHVVNVHPGMPSVPTQVRVARAVGAPFSVVRWMLRPDRRYDEAKAAFAPYDRLIAPHIEVRDDLATWLADTEGDVDVIVNNKAEGSAPASIVALAEALVARAS